MVALVQTAVFLPMMLLLLPAGALADMYDRRKVAIAGLAIAFASALALTAFSLVDLLTPWLLLLFCFLIGSGVALFGPAWQASVSEQVKAEHLPAAIGLSSISYNLARSFGPAIGGLVVAAFGSVATFGINALAYLPLMAAFFFWRREQVPARLPPERIDRAIRAGVRYSSHSPPIRVLLIRTLLTALGIASITALIPLVAKDLLDGGPGTYGLLLGSFGVGAVVGATFVARARSRAEPEPLIRVLGVISGAMIVSIGLSRSLPLSLAAAALCGGCWMLMSSLFNVGVQLSAPRWVTARALACWGVAVTGGMAIGAWVWGSLADEVGVGPALVVAGTALAGSTAIGIFLPVPAVEKAENDMLERRPEPEVNMDLTLRSGPIVIEVDYRVPLEQARNYYAAMLTLRRARLRSGAFDWSLSRDIAEPELWTERYHCPTWGDYLRQRDRATQTDREIEQQAAEYHISSEARRVRRRLERPVGSVRWRSDTPDPGDTGIINTP
jgi:MFS family permease